MVKNGQIQRKNLAIETLKEEELLSELRIVGVDDVKEAKQVTLEPNGQVSAIKVRPAKPVQNKDKRLFA